MLPLTGPDVVQGVVEQILRREFGAATKDRDGGFVVTRDQATVWVRITGLQPDQTAVVVFAVVAHDLAETDAACEYLAAESLELPLCHFELHGEGRVVAASHTLPGEYLSGVELRSAIDAVSGAAALYGPRVGQRFGAPAATAADPAHPPANPPPAQPPAGWTFQQRAALRPWVWAGGAVSATGLAWLTYAMSSSWWLCAYVLVATMACGLLLGAGLSGTSPGSALVIVLLLAAGSISTLLVAHALWARWWLAVLLATFLGPVLAVAGATPLVLVQDRRAARSRP